LKGIFQLRFYSWLKKHGHLDQLLGLRALAGAGSRLDTRKCIQTEIKRLGGRKPSSVGDTTPGSRRKSGSRNKEELEDAEMNHRRLSLLRSSIFFLDGRESDDFEEDTKKSGKIKSEPKLDQGLLWSPVF